MIILVAIILVQVAIIGIGFCIFAEKSLHIGKECLRLMEESALKSSDFIPILIAPPEFDVWSEDPVNKEAMHKAYGLLDSVVNGHMEIFPHGWKLEVHRRR